MLKLRFGVILVANSSERSSTIIHGLQLPFVIASITDLMHNSFIL